jgi:hypothetical protein
MLILIQVFSKGNRKGPSRVRKSSFRGARELIWEKR